MSPALNPGAQSFVPASSITLATQSASQHKLNPDALEFIYDNSQLAVSLSKQNNTSNRGSNHPTEPRDRLYRRRRNGNHPQLSSPKQLREFQTSRIVPFSQWQARVTGPRYHHTSSSQYASASSVDHQQYETVSFYKNGRYGEMQQKTKQRGLANVYGYNCSDKQAYEISRYRNGPHYPGQGQSRTYGRDFEKSSGQGCGYRPDKSHFSAGIAFGQLPGGPGALNLGCNMRYGGSGENGTAYCVRQPYGFTRGGLDLPGMSHGVNPHNFHNQLPVHNGEMLRFMPTPYHLQQPNVGPVHNMRLYQQLAQPGTITQVPVQALTQPLVGHVFPPSEPSNANPNVILRNPAIEQQEGSIVADHDFVTRVLQAQKTAYYHAKVAIIAAMYTEVKGRFFPTNVPSSLWPQKTPHQLGYIDRVHILSEMGEFQLNKLFEALTGGARN